MLSQRFPDAFRHRSIDIPVKINLYDQILYFPKEKNKRKSSHNAGRMQVFWLIKFLLRNSTILDLLATAARCVLYPRLRSHQESSAPCDSVIQPASQILVQIRKPNKTQNDRNRNQSHLTGYFQKSANIHTSFLSNRENVSNILIRNTR